MLAQVPTALEEVQSLVAAFEADIGLVEYGSPLEWSTYTRV